MSYRKAFVILAPITLTPLIALTPVQGQPKQVVTGPEAVYWLVADTVSGFGGMGGGMSLGALMGGNPENTQRTMQLYLGSKTTPPVTPVANHLPPAELKVGQTLPLIFFRKTDESIDERMPEGTPPRLLIYWGCGEKVRSGQPFVLDYSKQGANVGGATITGLEPPAPYKYPGFGEWPNRKSSTKIPMTSTLVGEHVVKANYAPEIRFSLTAANDFLSPLQPKQSPQTGGATVVQWSAVPNARAYFAGVMSSDDRRDIIVWTSSELRVTTTMGSLPYIGQAEMSRLLTQKVLMGPQQTACVIPSEVVKATKDNGMLTLTVLGQETDFVYPARPTNPAQPWHIKWTAKALNRATYIGMLGNDQGFDAADEEQQQREAEAPPAKRKKRSVLEKIGGGLF